MNSNNGYSASGSKGSGQQSRNFGPADTSGSGFNLGNSPFSDYQADPYMGRAGAADRNANYWGAPNGFNAWDGSDLAMLRQSPDGPSRQGPLDQSNPSKANLDYALKNGSPFSYSGF